MQRARNIGAGVLVAVHLLLAGYAASPLMEAHCVCDHAADADCDCPHHEAARSNLPPCHRKRHAPSSASANKGTALRAHCGSSGMKLMLLAQAPAPEPAPEHAIALPELPLPEPTATPLHRTTSPPRRPPRA
ncbi:MAG TPA: hypothetical protein VFA20_30095 [Myxococcaceae bacterium]|nr:hypothetical protein [Myxococcaceae bacterium]